MATTRIRLRHNIGGDWNVYDWNTDLLIGMVKRDRSRWVTLIFRRSGRWEPMAGTSPTRAEAIRRLPGVVWRP